LETKKYGFDWIKILNRNRNLILITTLQATALENAHEGSSKILMEEPLTFFVLDTAKLKVHRLYSSYINVLFMVEDPDPNILSYLII